MSSPPVPPHAVIRTDHRFFGALIALPVLACCFRLNCPPDLRIASKGSGEAHVN